MAAVASVRARHVKLAGRKPHARRNLLRLREIMVGRFLEALALECNEALISGAIAFGGIDGEREMPVADEAPAALLLLGKGRDLLLIEARIGAEAVGPAKIDNDHADRPVRLGLKLESPFDLERGAEQHCEC